MDKNKMIDMTLTTEPIQYNRVHVWLKNNFGSANKCENNKCDKSCDIYNWCLVLGKNYEEKRENFIELCNKCHKQYDLENRKSSLKSHKFKNQFLQIRIKDEEKQEIAEFANKRGFNSVSQFILYIVRKEMNKT